LAERFAQDQAGVGFDRAHPPPQQVVRQLPVVGLGIVAAQAQIEAPPAVRRAVAGARVAAADGHRPPDVLPKVDGPRRTHADRHLYVRREPRRLDDQRALALAPRGDETGGDVYQVAGADDGLGGEVAHRAVRVRAADDELSPIERPGQLDAL